MTSTEAEDGWGAPPVTEEGGWGEPPLQQDNSSWPVTQNSSKDIEENNSALKTEEKGNSKWETQDSAKKRDDWGSPLPNEDRTSQQSKRRSSNTRSEKKDRNVSASQTQTEKNGRDTSVLNSEEPSWGNVACNPDTGTPQQTTSEDSYVKYSHSKNRAASKKNSWSAGTSKTSENDNWNSGTSKPSDKGGWDPNSAKLPEKAGWGSNTPKPSDSRHPAQNTRDINEPEGNHGAGTDKTTEDNGWGTYDISDEANSHGWGNPDGNEPVEGSSKTASEWNSNKDSNNFSDFTCDFPKQDDLIEMNEIDYQELTTDYQKKDNQQRGSRGGRGSAFRARGRGSSHFPRNDRDNLKHESRGESDFRGHKRHSISRGGDNRDNESKDESNSDPTSVGPKPGSVYDSVHAPKSDSAPYVNKDRVLSGGGVRQRVDEEELSKRMERIRIQNEKILEKRKMVEEDEAKFRKTEDERKRKELEDQEIQKKLQEDEEELKRRREFQQRQLQEQIDQEREENAQRKIQNRDTREWDKEKEEAGWNSSRQNRRKIHEIRFSPGNPYVKNEDNEKFRNNDGEYEGYGRRGSRGNNEHGDYGRRNSRGNNYDNGSRNYRSDSNEYSGHSSRNFRSDSNEYGRYGSKNNHGESNEYGWSRGNRGGAGRGRGDRGRGGRGNLRGSGRQDSPSKTDDVGGFGSGNSWAEQQEEEISGKTNLWDTRAISEDESGWGKERNPSSNGWGSQKGDHDKEQEVDGWE